MFWTSATPCKIQWLACSPVSRSASIMRTTPASEEPHSQQRRITSSPSASPTSLHKEASSKGSFRVEPIESIDVTCVSELVKSLEGSTLTDGKTPMKIDYCAFVQAFGIVDTAEDALWLG